MGSGELVLLTGNICIPYEARSIPPQFKSILVPGKIHHIVCAGNLCTRSEVDLLLSTVKSKENVHVVKGPLDHELLLPETLTLSVGGLRIGCINGYQVPQNGSMSAFSSIANALDVDVLVYAGNELSVEEFEGRCYVSCGTLTGVNAPPSFALMNIGAHGDDIEFYLYSIIKNELSISKTTLSRKKAATPPFSPEIPLDLDI